MRKVFTYVLMMLVSTAVISQESHYWSNQHGPTSIFLGGAVTGGVRDNSHIYYNPGAAAFTSNFNLSIQSDALFYETLYLKNGAGTGLNMFHNSFESAPQMLAFTFGSKKRPKWRYSLGYLNIAYSNFRVRSRNETRTDLYPQIPEDEIYVGSWNYRNRIREDWYGMAVTRKIGEKLGIGLSAFITSRSYEYIETHDQNVYAFSPITNEYETIRYVAVSDNLDGAAAGGLLKLGVAYEIGDFKLGLTVTTPRVQIDFLSSMTLSSTLYSSFELADSSIKPVNYSLLYDRAVSTYESPWIIDFGVMKNFLKTDIYLRVAYHSKVDPYLMVEPKEQSDIARALSENAEGAGDVYMAQKEVWNVGIGWNRMYTEKFGAMAGFRTDFNYMDWETLDEKKGVVPALSQWNLYHASLGTNVKLLKHNFTVGVTYSFGREYSARQYVNLDAPEQGEVFREVENTATVHYDQWQLIIGYVYNFWN